MRKKALITGITGQDGSYLAEFLIEKGYEVFGFIRKSSSSSLQRIEALLDARKIHLVEGDLLRFYTPQGFTPVDRSKYDYSETKSIIEKSNTETEAENAEAQTEKENATETK